MVLWQRCRKSAGSFFSLESQCAQKVEAVLQPVNKVFILHSVMIHARLHGCGDMLFPGEADNIQ
jgi:hypothetical protein